ncbi:MAG: 4-hydroxy-tetrahydrodipicolinate synthase, partial [Prochlorothrix sp.]
YNKPSQEGLYQHFRTIAQACPDLPIMLYNVPGRTSCNLLPETVGRLAVVENIVAIKEASGNLDQASAVRGLVPGDFGLYSGDDSLTMPLLAVGGQGVVSVASHLVGDRLQTMIQAFEQGQVQAAIQLHQDLFSLFKTLFISTNPVPVKTALALQGWAVGNLRLPLVPMPEEQVEILRSVMQKLDLLPSP